MANKRLIPFVSSIICTVLMTCLPSYAQTTGNTSNRTADSTSNQIQNGRNVSSTKPKSRNSKNAQGDKSKFDGAAAYAYLKQICDIGPRISGTKGMEKQQLFLKKHFEGLGATIVGQAFYVPHPNTRVETLLTNAIVRFHPERKKRLMICCHYDTRPFADRDPINPRGAFIGANDGASGVGLLCELGKHMAALDGNYGIDLVFFDGEEFVYIYKRDQMFLGSTYFANQYAARRHDVKYQYAVLVDMVGDKNLEIHYEGNSLGYAGRLTRDIWGVAHDLGITEFKATQRHKIRDDHLPLNSIAGIRTCDIIDFDFPTENSDNAYWHTQKDIPENCSADSLQKVGTVVLEWIRKMEKRR